MLSSRSRVFFARKLVRSSPRREIGSTGSIPTTAAVSSLSTSSTASSSRDIATVVLAGALSIALVATSIDTSSSSHYTSLAARIPVSGDLIAIGKPTKEKSTGILFPALCNGLSLVGTGVRIKYVFVKVYAVGTYMDPIAMAAVKTGSKEDIERALLDPIYPRTIRIVMNRALAVDKFTAGIVESLEPRMKGQELEKLEEFKKLNPPVDLLEGAEIEMTIRGDTLLFKNAMGGVGSIVSRRFCEAMCDTYYGSQPVSPDHKDACMEGIRNL